MTASNMVWMIAAGVVSVCSILVTLGWRRYAKSKVIKKDDETFGKDVTKKISDAYEELERLREIGNNGHSKRA